MIKVNLLREQGVHIEKRKVSVPRVSGIGLVLLAIFVLLAAGLGAWWYIVNRDINNLTESREKLRAENLRLQGLRKQILEYEKMKKLRESRIQVIEKLKSNQTGPVELLNHLVLSIPQNVDIRLTHLDQKGDRIVITGYAKRSDIIPDLMNNLGGGKIFKTVDLESIQEEKEGAKFSLICISPGRTVAQ